MEIEMELQQRIEEGFKIAFNPPSGRYFYRAAVFQLGFEWEILDNLAFDYLESHQFDISYFTILQVIAWQTIGDHINDIWSRELRTNSVFYFYFFFIFILLATNINNIIKLV